MKSVRLTLFKRLKFLLMQLSHICIFNFYIYCLFVSTQHNFLTAHCGQRAIISPLSYRNISLNSFESSKEYDTSNYHVQVQVNVCAIQTTKNQRKELTSGVIKEGYIGELASSGVRFYLIYRSAQAKTQIGNKDYLPFSHRHPVSLWANRNRETDWPVVVQWSVYTCLCILGYY